MEKSIKKISHQIYPCLWFDGRAKEAADFYCNIFPNSFVLSTNPIVTMWKINEQEFMGLNGGPMYAFSPATSFVINCETQEEIDFYWENLGEAGVYNQCGWLADKFGVSWQIVPTILGMLMNNPAKSKMVIEAYRQMKKFDIETLIKAAE